MIGAPLRRFGIAAVLVLGCAGQSPLAQAGQDDYWWYSGTVMQTEEVQGAHLDLMWRFSPDFGMRVGTGRMELERSTPINDITLSENLSLDSSTLRLDFYPFAMPLHLTLGALYQDRNDVQLSADVSPGLLFLLGGKLYTSEQMGNVTGTISYPNVVPYAGIGLKWAIGRSHWLLTMDAGAVFGMEPQLNLYTDSTAGTIATDLQAEAGRLESELPTTYLIYSVGVAYGF